ncbi:hypothetical protein FQZ97_728470 [compost metagenome]
MVHGLQELAIHGDLERQTGARVGDHHHVVGRVTALRHSRGASGEHDRRAGESHVRGVAVADGQGVAGRDHHASARLAEADGARCSHAGVDDVLVRRVGGEGRHVAGQDGASTGDQRDVAHADGSGARGHVAGAGALGVHADGVGVAQGQAHDAVGHAVAQHVAGTSLVDLEQARLLAAQVADGGVAQGQLQVVGRRTVLFQDAQHPGEVGQVGRGAERGGASGTVAAAGVLVGFQPQVLLDLVHQGAHRLVEAIGLDGGEGAGVLQAAGFLAVPAHRDVLGLADGDRDAVDRSITGVRRGHAGGVVSRTGGGSDRDANLLTLCGARHIRVTGYCRDETGQLARNDVERLVQVRYEVGESVSHGGRSPDMKKPASAGLGVACAGSRPAD